MVFVKNLPEEYSNSKRFLISYCILCISLFFKDIFSQSFFVDVILIFTFFFCIFNFVVHFIYLLFSIKRQKEFVLNFLYILSFCITSIRATSLFFARIYQSKPGLIWNADIGFSLSHAQNILRHGDLENSISMDSFPEAYHIGPSYIAGIIPRYFPISLDFIALFVLPLLFIGCFMIVSKLIINFLVNNSKLEKSLSIILCITPGLFLFEPNLKNILDNNLNLFLSKLIYNIPYHIPAMHNSMMGGAAFLCIFYLLITSFEKNLYLILITSLSLSTIKPLYFVSSFVVIILYLILIYIYKYKSDYFENELKIFTRFKPIFLSTIITLIWFYIYKINSVPFYKVSISFSILKDFIRSLKLFSWNELKYTLWPIHNTIIYLPIISLIFFVFMLVIKFNKGSNLDIKKRFFIDFCSLILVSSIFMQLISLAFSLSYKVTNESNIFLGLMADQIPNNYGEYLILESQASYPLFTLVTIIGFAFTIQIIKSNPSSYRYFYKFISKIFLIFTILFNFIHTSFLVTKENYVNQLFSIDRDEVDETNYRKLLKSIPIENSLLLSNTVEAGFYGRTFRNTYLTAYTPHSHFLANIYDYHWRSSLEGPRRVNIYKKIFPDNIDKIGIYNPDSINLIRENNISHLLLKKVKDKQNYSEFEGIKLLEENQTWALFKVIY